MFEDTCREKLRNAEALQRKEQALDYELHIVGDGE